MLILKANRDELLKPLQTVSGVVDNRHTLPILSNILMESHNKQTRFWGTDLEIQIHTDGPQAEEDFKITVNAKKLQDILRALPDSSEVSLTQEENRLTLKAGRGRYHLQTLNPEDFPTMSVAEEIQACFTLSQDALRQMLAQVQYAMALKDIRFYLNGLLMQVEGNQLRFVATDGHRMAYSCATIEAELPANEVILPRKTVLELLKLLSFPNEPVTVEFLHNQVRFRCRETVVVSKVVEGKFPDYNRVIPQDNDKIFLINRTNLLGAFERAAILSSEKFRGVNIQVQAGLLSLVCSNNDQEKAQEDLEIAYQGDGVEMGFNIQYLMEVLRNLHCEDVQLAFDNATRPVLITIPDFADFKYIVMPMRI